MQSNLKSSKPLIFIVDDVPKNLQYLGSLLREQGYRVSFASNGEQALGMLKEITPDLVLLDIVMPGMNGFEVCNKMKSDSQTKDIPVIFLTSQTKVDHIIQGFELGAVDYVGKPFNPKELLVRVETQLEIKHSRDLIVNYNKELTLVNNKLVSELDAAAQYVISLLPQKMEDKINVDWKFVPSEHLGGDSFGYGWLDENNFYVFLIDVSGHGVGSALLSISVLNILKSRSLTDCDFYDPASVLMSLNKKFKMEEHDDKYFAIWYGVIDITKNSLLFSSAFHPPALYLNKRGSHQFDELKMEAMMIGALEDQTFENKTLKMEKGSKLLLFSDGTYELANSQNEVLDYNRFKKILSQNLDNENKLDSIFNDLAKFNGTEKFDDDYSMLIIEI